MPMKDWVSLPTRWIEEGGLDELQWTAREASGSDNVAALMVLAPIAHNAGDQGLARCTYDQLALGTGLSRSKVSAGLSILDALHVIQREPSGRSTFQLTGYNLAGGWSKLPARRLYSAGRILAFDHFKLRNVTELHALKLYYLFARRRSNQTNMAHLTYDTIEEFTGIERTRIRRAISFLSAIGLIHVEHLPSRLYERGTANAYRLAFLDSYNHLGTRGRDLDLALAE
jgi:hypothetical protein